MRVSPTQRSCTWRCAIRAETSGVWPTQDAQWSPTNAAQLVGRSIDDADIDDETGELRCGLSDGTILSVKPAAVESEEDPPNWELFSPAGIVLEFGPGVRWQISSADAPTSSRR